MGRRGSVTGAAASAHDEAEAERQVKVLLKALEMPAEEEALAGRGRWRDEKALVAGLVRQRTGVGNRWIAERLAMGHESSASHALRRLRKEATLGRKAHKLERLLHFTD